MPWCECGEFREDESAVPKERIQTVVSIDGTPNQEIHPLTKALTAVLAAMFTRGMASGQWGTYQCR